MSRSCALPYHHQPRWRRALRCLKALPWGCGYAVRVWRYLRRSKANRPALPNWLASVERKTPGALDPHACQTVVHRIVTRSRKHRCLPRALVLFAALQHTRCTNVRFCIGVRAPVNQDERFAHAWVETDGHPFGEGSNPRHSHRLLYTYPEPADASADFDPIVSARYA